MLKNTLNMKRDISLAKFTAISRQTPPASLLGVSAGNCYRTLVDGSGITNSEGDAQQIVTIAVYGTPCAILNSNIKVYINITFNLRQGL
jgi:hypothetical protein